MVVNINGASVNSEVFGKDGGIPVLLLHGWGSSIEGMTSMWRFLESKEKYKIEIQSYRAQQDQWKTEIFIGLLPMLIFVNFYLKSSYYQLFRLTNFLKSDIIAYV